MRNEQDMLDRIKTNSLQNTLAWQSSRAIVTLLLDTLVAHSGKTLSFNILQHSCKTLLLETLAWHVCTDNIAVLPRTTLNCKYIFHMKITSPTLHNKACTKNFLVYNFALQNTTKLAQATSEYYFVLESLHKFSPQFTLHTPRFTLHTAHFTLQTAHFTLHTPHSTLHTS